MQTSINVTGLPAEVIQSLELLVQTLRVRFANPRPDPADMSPEERLAAWKEWVAMPRPVGPIADDSRESIYEGRGE